MPIIPDIILITILERKTKRDLSPPTERACVEHKSISRRHVFFLEDLKIPKHAHPRKRKKNRRHRESTVMNDRYLISRQPAEVHFENGEA
jgi:hypothetical protein